MTKKKVKIVDIGGMRDVEIEDTEEDFHINALSAMYNLMKVSDTELPEYVAQKSRIIIKNVDQKVINILDELKFNQK